MKRLFSVLLVAFFAWLGMSLAYDFSTGELTLLDALYERIDVIVEQWGQPAATVLIKTLVSIQDVLVEEDQNFSRNMAIFDELIHYTWDNWVVELEENLCVSYVDFFAFDQERDGILEDIYSRFGDDVDFCTGKVEQDAFKQSCVSRWGTTELQSCCHPSESYQTMTCYEVFPDAGKSCSRDEQCLGYCDVDDYDFRNLCELYEARAEEYDELFFDIEYWSTVVTWEDQLALLLERYAPAYYYYQCPTKRPWVCSESDYHYWNGARDDFSADDDIYVWHVWSSGP